MKGPILCFVGPPGVGKTSLGKSIARALGRKFVRISLGGVHDEAEIRGHRRTYIGALPGQIIQGIRRAETKDPVFMLDEIDKVGRDFRGDPGSALLEALDPEQNSTFRDNYLDVPFDLSKVLFITTANMLDPIAEPLRDRMEIIELQGYTEEEKVHIAFQYLVPRQIEENGVTAEQIEFPEEAVGYMIRHYTREAGVRNLERNIGTICRKQARRMAEGKTDKLVVTPEIVQEFLGGIKIRTEGEIAERTKRAGVVVGLAWTPSGGDVLFVEANMMKGKGGFTMTGQIGQVMQESMQAALTWVRSNATQLGIHGEFLRRARHSHSRAGGSHSERWSFSRRDHGDRSGFAADGTPGAAVNSDDRRDHAERECSSDRWSQGKGPGREARGRTRRHSPGGKQDERGGRSHAGATRELRRSLCEDHRRSAGIGAALDPERGKAGRRRAGESAHSSGRIVILLRQSTLRCQFPEANLKGNWHFYIPKCLFIRRVHDLSCVTKFRFRGLIVVRAAQFGRSEETNMPKTKTYRGWFVGVLLAAVLLVLQSPLNVRAQDDQNDSDQDPPSRVARLNYAQGSVTFQPGGEGDWVTASPTGR